MKCKIDVKNNNVSYESTEREAITDESIGVSQLLGARALAAPQSLHKRL